MNNRSENWYAELGKYITHTLNIEKIPHLSYFANRVKEKGVITKIKDFISPDSRTYSGIAINFLTAALDEVALERMFGKPLLHSEFGEGFDGEWNEELDDYDEPQIKDFYASYFVNIDGVEFHIGYDHRGTGIEIGLPKKFDYNTNPSNEEAKGCFEALKKLIDLYKKTQ